MIAAVFDAKEVSRSLKTDYRLSTSNHHVRLVRMRPHWGFFDRLVYLDRRSPNPWGAFNNIMLCSVVREIPGVGPDECISI